ncbi:hypothetical protein IFM46972_02799 [Aspergillus udagawae]|uniref:Stress-response A/B barrel domain-containing protein n=1 Tax=Aspergillus udagawae TaxID=91492 RepID=A0A8H3NA18_9EURO|nr:hypothetical protein IFM46972_02799 [Aspergillus udagawae]
MPVYHIVLFRLKPGVTQAQVANWATVAESMVGRIPGLISLKAGQPLPISVPRAKGFDMGLVAVMESPGAVATYATHPVHLEFVSATNVCLLSKLREELCDDTLAYDLEFEN